jgi:hypothetical protein
MLKGHLPRVIYHQVYSYTKKTQQLYASERGGTRCEGSSSPEPPRRDTILREGDIMFLREGNVMFVREGNAQSSERALHLDAASVGVLTWR